MSLDCSNHRRVAGLDNRASRNRRRDAQSFYAADDGSGWVSRARSAYDWHSGRMAMGTCGRHAVAGWMDFVRGRSSAPSQRAELVCECPRATGATLCCRGNSKALQRQAPTGLALKPVPGYAQHGSRRRQGHGNAVPDIGQKHLPHVDSGSKFVANERTAKANRLEPRRVRRPIH